MNSFAIQDAPVTRKNLNAAAGISTNADLELDGVSLLPFVAGRSQGRPHEGLFWRMGDLAAARVEHWKLVMEAGRRDALFDLKTDGAERHDLASTDPEKVNGLRAAYAEWEKGMIEPKWEDEYGFGRPRARSADSSEQE